MAEWILVLLLIAIFGVLMAKWVTKPKPQSHRLQSKHGDVSISIESHNQTGGLVIGQVDAGVQISVPLNALIWWEPIKIDGFNRLQIKLGNGRIYRGGVWTEYPSGKVVNSLGPIWEALERYEWQIENKVPGMSRFRRELVEAQAAIDDVSSGRVGGPSHLHQEGARAYSCSDPNCRLPRV